MLLNFEKKKDFKHLLKKIVQKIAVYPICSKNEIQDSVHFHLNSNVVKCYPISKKICFQHTFHRNCVNEKSFDRLTDYISVCSFQSLKENEREKQQVRINVCYNKSFVRIEYITLEMVSEALLSCSCFDMLIFRTIQNHSYLKVMETFV